MKTRAIATLLALLLGASVNFAQDTQAAPASLVGVWRGQMDNLPTVTLTIRDEGGKLSGAILFFMHVRATENDPWTSRPATAAEPILNPVFDGKTLRFMVSHKYAHPPRTLNDPPSHFHLTFTGPNQAGFVNETESGSADPGPGLPMVRSDY